MQKSLCDAMRLIDALGGNKSPSHTRDAFNEQAACLGKAFAMREQKNDFNRIKASLVAIVT
jgi:hypothetical protein